MKKKKLSEDEIDFRAIRDRDSEPTRSYEAVLNELKKEIPVAFSLAEARARKLFELERRTQKGYNRPQSGYSDENRHSFFHAIQ